MAGSSCRRWRPATSSTGRRAASRPVEDRLAPSTARANCTLITIPISHFCGTARWALDRAGVDDEERAHLRVLRWAAVKRARADGKTVPVLVCGDTVLSESADILAFADERAPAAMRIYPDDPPARAEIRALEQDFDDRLGPQGAALPSAVLMPPQYGVPLSQPDELPPATGAVVRELREHPAGRFALRMFREERGTVRRSARRAAA